MMNENGNKEKNSTKDEKSTKFYTQIIHLNKNKDLNCKTIENLYENDESLDETNNAIIFKINKMSYFDVKNRNFKKFGFGKIKLTRKDSNYINIIFHDSSLQLRFQGLISIKLSSLILDTNKTNCVIIKKIIGFIYHINDIGETNTENIITDIHLYFKTEDDIDTFINSILHI